MLHRLGIAMILADSYHCDTNGNKMLWGSQFVFKKHFLISYLTLLTKTLRLS